MISIQKKERFHCDVKTLWNIITSLENFKWRTDLEDIKIINDKVFVEHGKGGYKTTMTTTCFEPYKRWEFDIENDNMKGHWIGELREFNEGVEVEFTEFIDVKKRIMKPFASLYLKKQQSQYMKDLHAEISKQMG